MTFNMHTITVLNITFFSVTTGPFESNLCLNDQWISLHKLDVFE